MSFAALVDDAVTGDGDVIATMRKCYLYDFDGYPTRLWDGEGVLYAGAQEWLGTIGPDGVDYHQVANVTDARDGSNPEYRFGLPYIDLATYDGLRADQALANGRILTCWRAIILPTEGLRPATALTFAWAMTMRDVQFSRRRGGAPGNDQTFYSAQLVCRSVEAGRARVPGGTYTDTAQQERARILGVASDSFCAFVAANARRTMTFG